LPNKYFLILNITSLKNNCEIAAAVMASFRLVKRQSSLMSKFAGLAVAYSCVSPLESGASNGRNIEDVYDLLDNRPIGMVRVVIFK
jgi:hypothetical protein